MQPEQSYGTAPLPAAEKGEPSVHQSAWSSSLLLTAVGSIVALPLLNPVHRLPLPSFESEFLAAAALSLALVFAGVLGGRPFSAGWRMPALLVGLALLVLVQRQLGMLTYAYQMIVFSQTMIAALVAYLLGRYFACAGLVRRVTVAICAAAIVSGLLSVGLQWVQLFDLRFVPEWARFEVLDPFLRRRPFANTGQPNHLATYLAIGCAGCLYWARTFDHRSAALLAAFVLALGIGQTGSRMGLLYVAMLVAACLMVPGLRSSALNDRGWMTASLLAGTIAGMLLVRLALLSVDAGARSAIERFGEGSLGYRLSLWDSALRIAAAHPLLGAGAGEFARHQYQLAVPHPLLQSSTHSHNLILQLAAELGWPAALAVVVALAAWFLRGARTRLQDPATAFGLLAVAVVTVHSMLEFPLWHLNFLVLTAVLIGMAEQVPNAAMPARAGLALRPRFIFVLLGTAGFGAATVMQLDYRAVSNLTIRFYDERFSGKPFQPETMLEILGAQTSTFFKPQAERMAIELMPPNKQVGEEFVDLSARVLSRLAEPQLIARHVLLLVQLGRVDEAAWHAERLQQFYAGQDQLEKLRTYLLGELQNSGDVVEPLRKALRPDG
jgi:O-antigen ligase